MAHSRRGPVGGGGWKHEFCPSGSLHGARGASRVPAAQLSPVLSGQEEKKVPPPIPKKPSRGRGVPVKERSLDSVDRQRQEARKRLLAAKRAASFRHSSATESADSIEIYIPEAQTRL